MDHDMHNGGSTNELTFERLGELGLDIRGLSAVPYGPEHEDLIQEWWGHRHRGGFPLALLPPLGVVVLDEGHPSGMIFCYECYGVGVGFLEFAVTRPGMGLRKAGAVLGFAVASCMQLAGKCVEPVANVPYFRVSTSAASARFLLRLGFSFTGKIERGMIYNNT